MYMIGARRTNAALFMPANIQNLRQYECCGVPLKTKCSVKEVPQRGNLGGRHRRQDVEHPEDLGIHSKRQRIDRQAAQAHRSEFYEPSGAGAETRRGKLRTYRTPSSADALLSPALRSPKRKGTSATRSSGLRTMISSRILKPAG